jgi:hypothetical protein
MKKKVLAFCLAVLMFSVIISETGINADAQVQSTVDLDQISEIGKEISQIECNSDLYSPVEISLLYQDAVDRLGVETFPQYEQKLNTYSVEKDMGEYLGEVIYSETVAVSETEKMTYNEYASGRSSLLYQKSWYNRTSTSVSGGNKYQGTFILTVTGCTGSIYVSGFQYTIYNSKYDMINSVGTCTDNSGNTVALLKKQYENSSGDAYATYAGYVTDLLYSYLVGVSFDLRVGRNDVRVYVNDSEI